METSCDKDRNANSRNIKEITGDDAIRHSRDIMNQLLVQT